MRVRFGGRWPEAGDGEARFLCPGDIRVCTPSKSIRRKGLPCHPRFLVHAILVILAGTISIGVPGTFDCVFIFFILFVLIII